MKKFSKLIAVVLAIAVIICPMMSVVSHATTTNGYKIEANPNDANELMLTISSTDGFVAYDATVTFNGSSAFQSTYDTGDYDNGLRLISREVKGGEANSHNLPTISSNMTNDTTLKVIVIKDDFTGDDLYTKLVIGLRVAAGSTATLTKLQAADEGTVADDPTLLTFPAANESTGEIDQTDEYAKENATITVHTHDLTLVPAKDATCTAAGNSAYYTCSGCDKIFSDSEGTTETTLQDVTIAATGHTVVEDAAVAATCTETGLTAGSHCSVCNTVLVAQTVVPATGHTPAEAVVENNVPATCNTAGHYDSVVKCSVCNTELSRETVNVPATGHTPATAVEENRVEATCGVDGHYDSVVYCSECDAEISRETIVIPATGNHNWGEWTIDADGHSRTCSVCNAVDSGTHDGSPCSVCGYEAAPAHVHVYGEIQYKVNELNKCVTFRACECGDEDVIATLDNLTVSPNLVVAAGLAIRFRIANSTGINTTYTNVHASIQHDKYGDSGYTGRSTPAIISAVAQGKNQQFEYTGLASYEMTSTIYVDVYGTLGDNKLLLARRTCSFADEIKAKMASTDSAQTKEYKDFYADLLRYGASSQIYMNRNIENLANAGIEELYGSTYGTDLPTSFVPVNSASGIAISPNVVVGNQFFYRLRIKQSAVSSYELANLRLVVEYKNAKDETVSTTFNGTDFVQQGTTSNPNWQVEFTDLPVVSITGTMNVKLYDDSTEIGSLDYSFQTYASTRYASEGADATASAYKLSILCRAACAYGNSLRIAYGLPV